jgi:HPt (histidine-containing phosphotransfer) domain-containing protein
MPKWDHARDDRGYKDEALSDEKPNIVDWALFEKNRAELGPGFIRILSYFREDGAKSVAEIEHAMREQNTIALVLPAHTIKGEARQIGAEPLAVAAELIESTARLCIETHRFPDELVPQVVDLRRLFNETVALFEKETNPLVTRSGPGGFGRKVSNQGFGRI